MVVLSLSSCESKETEKKEVKSKTENYMGTIHLTKDEFLKKVVNYETNSK